MIRISAFLFSYEDTPNFTLFLFLPERCPKKCRCHQNIHQINAISDAVAPRKTTCGMSQCIHHKTHCQHQKQKPQFPACFFRHKTAPFTLSYFQHSTADVSLTSTFVLFTDIKKKGKSLLLYRNSSTSSAGVSTTASAPQAANSSRLP